MEDLYRTAIGESARDVIASASSPHDGNSPSEQGGEMNLSSQATSRDSAPPRPEFKPMATFQTALQRAALLDVPPRTRLVIGVAGVAGIGLIAWAGVCAKVLSRARFGLLKEQGICVEAFSRHMSSHVMKGVEPC